MKPFSAILTKVNTCSPSFNDQIEDKQKKGNYENLREFVNLIHGKQKTTEIQELPEQIKVYTGKNMYTYSIGAKFITRLSASNINSLKHPDQKKFYKIS